MFDRQRANVRVFLRLVIRVAVGWLHVMRNGTLNHTYRQDWANRGGAQMFSMRVL